MVRQFSTKVKLPPPPMILPSGYAINPKETHMLRYQASLPKLPVPTLESTCAKYLETVQPLLTPDDYAKTQSVVSSFLASPLSAVLQSRLEHRAAQPDTLNWLSDWWNDVAYMGYRDPVVVYVSYHYVHLDDPSRTDPAARAASLIKAMIPFRDIVEKYFPLLTIIPFYLLPFLSYRGLLEPDKIRGTPLCMSSFKWLFHSSRYPQRPSDTARKFDPATNNHIIVIRKNRFFFVPIADISGREYSLAEIEIQLQNIIAYAGSEASPTPVGALTSDNRDLWTDAREALLMASPSGKNAQLLEKIEGAMIILALDDTKPVTRKEIGWSTWVGDGRNRWFDKHQRKPYFVLAITLHLDNSFMNSDCV
jgi:carnitine O-acetyltransferase